MPSEHVALERFFTHASYVRCRTFGHSWDDIPVTEPHPDGHSFWLRCVNCTMVRKDVFDRRYGELLHRQYEQPPDYSLAMDETPTRNDFRLRLFDIAQSLSDRRSRRAAKVPA
jgi:hypothetical protein